MNDTPSNNECRKVVQQVITSENEWQWKTASGTKSGTTSDSEWQQMTTSDN